MSDEEGIRILDRCGDRAGVGSAGHVQLGGDELMGQNIGGISFWWGIENIQGFGLAVTHTPPG